MTSKPEVKVEEEDTAEVTESVDSKILVMASSVITGNVWNMEEADIAEFQVKFRAFVKGLLGIEKSFNDQLKGKRAANGADFLPSVKYSRKPRETKDETSLLDALKL